MKESGWLLGVWLEHFCGQWCHFLRKGAVVKMLHSEGAEDLHFQMFRKQLTL